MQTSEIYITYTKHGALVVVPDIGNFPIASMQGVQKYMNTMLVAFIGDDNSVTFSSGQLTDALIEKLRIILATRFMNDMVSSEIISSCLNSRWEYDPSMTLSEFVVDPVDTSIKINLSITPKRSISGIKLAITVS